MVEIDTEKDLVSDGSSCSQSELDHHANQSNTNMIVKALMIITPIN